MTNHNETTAESWEEEEQRKRRIKTLLILALLLLLGLFFIIFLYFLLFVPRKPAPTPTKPMQFLFSVYGLSRPLGVSTDKDANIYVSDTGNNRVLVFDKRGNYVRRIGSDKKPTKLYAVYGSVVNDKKGRIYICDWTFRVVHIFTTKGKFVGRFPKDPFGREYGPLGFTPYDIDLFKGKLYVTSNDGIYTFSEKGKLIDHWGQKGRDLGSYDFPNGIAIDKKRGEIYVSDTLNRRLVALTPKGKIRWVVGKPDVEGKIVSFLGLPKGVEIDPEGRIYVTDNFHHQIIIIRRDGKLLSAVGSRGVEDAKFNFPEGIAITADGVIYVADRQNGRVQALRVGLFPRPSSDLARKYRESFQKPQKKIKNAK